MQYIRSLDGLRAVAVLMVMAFHFRLFEFGWAGVQMFFVLSGFLITSILLKDKQKPFSQYLKVFYWRRSLRIFPLFYAYLIIIAIGYLLFKEPENFSFLSKYLFTYTYNFSRLSSDWSHSPLFTHLWSLSVEEQFYLFWPFIIYFFSIKQLKHIIIGILIIVPIFRLVLGEYLLIQTNFTTHDVGEIVYWFTVSHIDAFAIGAAIPLFNLKDLIQKKRQLVWLSFGLVILAGVINYISQNNSNIEISSLGYPIGGMANYQSVWSYTVLNVFFTLLILNLISVENNKKRNVLNNKLLVSMGKVSYGMYLYHWALLAILERTILYEVFNNRLLAFPIYALIVYLVSYISFQVFEKRFLALKDKKASVKEIIILPLRFFKVSNN